MVMRHCTPEFGCDVTICMYTYAGSAARAPVRVRTVKCRAIAAPPKEAQHAPTVGPIIMNGQVLHSATEKQLELVRGMSTNGYLQKQVRRGAS